METAPPALAKTGDQKPGLGERLATRKGHAASGGFEKDPVPFSSSSTRLVNLVVAPRELTSIGRTGLDARATTGAGAAIPELPRRYRTAVLDRADLRTGAARDAAIGVDHQNRSLVDPLRIVTPAARERAALEKDRGPDARSVVHRTPLEVENPPSIAGQRCLGNCVRRHMLSIHKMIHKNNLVLYDSRDATSFSAQFDMKIEPELHAILRESSFAETLFDRIPDVVFFIKDREGRYRGGQPDPGRALRRHDQERPPRPHRATGLSLSTRKPLSRTGPRSVLASGIPIVQNLELHLYPTRLEGWCLTDKVPLCGRQWSGHGHCRNLARPAVTRSRGRSLAELAAVLDHTRSNFGTELRVEDLARDLPGSRSTNSTAVCGCSLASPRANW